MRAQFSGYFDPTPDQLEALWGGHDSMIALDTNVLLGLYRMPAATREEVVELLTRLKDRLWVPYHVLLEFHRNRQQAMKAEFAAAKQLGKDARNAYDVFKATISNDRVRDRACWPQIAEKLAEIEKKAEELFKVTNSESGHYISPNAPDSVLSFVENLLEGRIGSRPGSQAIVDSAEELAAERFKAKIGPGYYDQEKAGDKYVFDGLIYDRQYGDYMVWRELIAHSRETKTKRVMFVTSDVKPDWWLDSRTFSGKRPQPELVMEMLREAAVECFWMYTLSDFIKNAGTFLRTKVTQRAISDARQAESGPRREAPAATPADARLRRVGNDDLRTVVAGQADDLISVGRHIGIGLARAQGKGVTGIVAIDPQAILTRGMALLDDLKSSVDLLSLFDEIGGLELYVILPKNQPELMAHALKTARSLAEGLDLQTVAPQVFVGHFLNAGRTEYTFSG